MDHYQVDIASDEVSVLGLARRSNYDLVLLGLSLSELKSIDFCRRLRSQSRDILILLLSVEEAVAKKIIGVKGGADSYLTKPLDLDQLLIKVRSLLHHKQPHTSPLLAWSNVRLDSVSYAASMSAKTTNTLERNLGVAPKPLDSKGSHTQSLDPLSATWNQHCLKYLELAVSLNEVIPFLQAQDSTHLAKRHKAVDTKATDNDTKKNAVLRRSQAAAHTLKGTLGSFGLNQASQIASQIEIYLSMTSSLTTRQIEQLERLIDSLEHSLVRFEPDASISNSSFDSSSLESSTSAFADNLTPATFVTYPRLESNNASVTKSATGTVLDALYSPTLGHQSGHQSSVVYDWLIIDSDQHMTESLLHQASISGLYPQVAHSLTEARRRLAQQLPNVVTFDPSCAPSWGEGIAFLAELTSEYPSLPILVISEQDSLTARVNVVRSGGCTFLHKPMDVAQILETVAYTVTKRASTDVRIVALDDNPETLLHLQSLLGPWGFQLTLLSEPTQLWQALEKTLPDLLILDLEMPQFNGLELCQVIRSDPRTAQIPILFLSAHTAPEIVREVFEAGADDYISKPVVDHELIGRILNRLERQRLLRKLAEIDSLTGLSRRRQSAETLERLLRLSVRQGVPLCMALLDLDHFKQINDRYGHDVGDQVLKVFAEYLRNSFRGEDVVARWGGEEFVVGLYNVSKERSLQRLNTLRESFGQHIFQAKSSAFYQSDLLLEFQVSLSGGMVTAPADGETVEMLYRRADQALYRAKAAGRNQICIFGR
ncbi:GGDEF domain protein [Synechococcus sp. PCC 7335]|nr:GGDEF domain protein [Synechococcus sp. PCC 7335]